jgi:hypothetical protein
MSNQMRERDLGTSNSTRFAPNSYRDGVVDLPVPSRYGIIDDEGVVTLPAGTYVIGDPCYVIEDGEWSDFCESTKDENLIVAPHGDGHAVGVHTVHGDGRYYGDDGNEYPVDSGMIGLVPVEGPIEGHDFVTFDEDIRCMRDGGYIVLGHIRIDTDPEVEPEEEVCHTCGADGDD